MPGYDSVGSLGTASNPFSVTSSGSGANADQVQGTAANGAPATGNPIRLGAVNRNARPTVSDGQISELGATTTGHLRVAVTGVGGAGADAFNNGLMTFMTATVDGGDGTARLTGVGGFVYDPVAGTWARQRGDTSGTYVTSIPSLTAPALVTHSRLASADINATVVKAAKATLYAFQFFNNTAAAKYVKLYNKATAPAPATDAALIVRRLVIPANGILSFHAEEGLGAFTSGLAYAITGAIADTDTTAVAAADVAVNIDYI